MARKGENIFRRKDGRWEARYICGRNADGKAVYRFIYGKTYTEVREKKRAAQAMPEAVAAVSNGVETLEVLCGRWLSQVRQSVKESTYTRYHRAVTKYILPRIGTLAPSELDAVRINSFSEELLCRGGLRGA